MRDLYEDKYIVSVQSYSGMQTEKKSNSRVINKEILITNYLPDSMKVSRIEGTRQMRMVLDQNSSEYQIVEQESDT
jgi:hypothetical protein